MGRDESRRFVAEFLTEVFWARHRGVWHAVECVRVDYGWRGTPTYGAAFQCGAVGTVYDKDWPLSRAHVRDMRAVRRRMCAGCRRAVEGLRRDVLARIRAAGVTGEPHEGE